MITDTTIAAISTPPGIGGIAIIRMSGKNAFSIAKKVFLCKTSFDKLSSHSITYGKIVDNNKNIIDQVMLVKLVAPKTYTKEDMVEIQCHGGNEVTKKILRLLFSHGAVLAQPGQFTKRAFLQGRIDLSQAEAVMDLINAETSKSEKAAILQLEGRTGKRIKEIRQEILDILSHISVSIDYPEYEDDVISIEKTKEITKKIIIKLRKLIENYETGIIIREGLNVVIYGPPNAGKSTFVNKVAGQEKAIVTHIPGTTRDIIEVHLNIGGYPVNLYDTAGIRKTDDLIEKIGIEKTISAIKNSSLSILVIDSSEMITSELVELIKKAEVVVLNKIDLSNGEKYHKYLKGKKVIRTSLLNNKGIEEIEQYLLSYIETGGIDIDDIVITNQRHKQLIDYALSALIKITKNKEQFLDLYAIDFHEALEALSQITGESAGEDVIANIFKNFCVGK